jgi:hypothetical protein
MNRPGGMNIKPNERVQTDDGSFCFLSLSLNIKDIYFIVKLPKKPVKQPGMFIFTSKI